VRDTCQWCSAPATKARRGRVVYACGSDYQASIDRWWQTRQCQQVSGVVAKVVALKQPEPEPEPPKAKPRYVARPSRYTELLMAIAAMQPGHQMEASLTPAQVRGAIRLRPEDPAKKYVLRTVPIGCRIVCVRRDGWTVADQIASLSDGESVVIACSIKTAQSYGAAELRKHERPSWKYVCRSVDGGTRVTRQPRVSHLQVGESVRFGPDLDAAFYLVQTLVTQYISKATDKMFGLSFDGEFYWIARLR
jgi:hypothetical protein